MRGMKRLNFKVLQPRRGIRESGPPTAETGFFISLSPLYLLISYLLKVFLYSNHFGRGGMRQRGEVNQYLACAAGSFGEARRKVQAAAEEPIRRPRIQTQFVNPFRGTKPQLCERFVPLPPGPVVVREGDVVP